MTVDETQRGKILHALQERAKELNCLYRVGELLNLHDAPIEEVLRGILEVIPPGWQYPELCQARITLEDSVVQSANFHPTPWVQSAKIVVQEEQIGAIEVSYREQLPRSDEGPFLNEERRLLETIAERIGSSVMQRRLKLAFEHWEATPESPAGKHEWRVVVEFLRDTDPVLLKRIARKLVNHLSWTGVPEAKELLQRGSSKALTPSDENRPLRNDQNHADLTKEAFQIAAHHLADSDILNFVTRWIKEDKASYLVRALEDQDTALGDIIESIERYRHGVVGEEELSISARKGIRVSLIRRFFSENLDFINVAKEFIEVKDFYELLDKIILSPRCHGKLGGKSAGLFLARKIIEKSLDCSQRLHEIKVPRTWYITSDWILHFVHFNDLEDVLNRKYMEIDQIRQEYPHLVSVFKSCSFPPDLAKGLSLVLEDLGDKPLIVRSSSLLEDRFGSAFSGKYKSLFLGSQGTKEERLSALMDAVAEVYASIFGPDPTEYRVERGLIDVHEEMGIMIEEVVGTKMGKYFLPACSGVAFSNNEFRWSARIKRTDGLIRLVPGLGTRAVDRVADDYPVLIAPGQPTLRANVTVDEVLKYSPKKIDVINLESNAFETVDAIELLRSCQSEYPQLRRMISFVDHDRIEQPIGLFPDLNACTPVFTFEGLIRHTPFVDCLRDLLDLLQQKLGSPVDIEFAYDGTDLYLLQCRPQSYTSDAAPSPIPQNLPPDKVVFSASRYISNGKVPDITHIVYVDLQRYSQLSESAMRDVGHAVSRLNKLLPKRQFILIGPGRWGSRGDIRLGVPVTYSDINNTAMLVEVARQKGNYLPDLSFGTHFFQDLVEAAIRYLPLYPDDPGTTFSEAFLCRSQNVLEQMLPEFASLSDTLRVVDIPSETRGLVLRVLMNAELEQAVAYLAPPQHGKTSRDTDLEVIDHAGDDHWRWRFRMAQRIATQIGSKQFGVKAVYLIGSTKNATAGPASDIDLLIHFAGSDHQRGEMMLWLEGWSRCLSELNFLRTGYHSEGLLDVHVITDDDIAARSSYAVKIDAITDPARKLALHEN
jgi:hypothetical protein